jgi:NTP pyrophosphatase (non-canonical NTP hydrolase)
MMDLDQYQQDLISLNAFFKIEGDQFEFCCIGLAEEAGEVMGKIKRALRGEDWNRTAYLMELGDVLGYLALAAGARDVEMSKLFYLTVPAAPIVADTDLHLKASSKSLYRTASDLLNETRMYDAEHITWLMSLVLGNLNWCIEAAGSGLTEVMQLNLQKLDDRLKRNGTLLGTGDNR